MDNRPDIWRRLQDHEMPPPPEAFDRLQRALPVSDGDAPGGLERLGQHAVRPPFFLRRSIKKLTGTPKNPVAGPAKPGSAGRAPAKGRLRSIRPSRLVYGAAAACILLVAGLMLYHTLFTRNSPSTGIAHTTITPPATPVTGAQSEDTALSRNNALPGDSAGTAVGLVADATDSMSSARTASSGTSRRSRPSSMFIDNHPLPLVDNDLLITLTSFKYPEVADYVSKGEDKALKVRLDQYTNIVISKQAAGMIKEMYQKRSNGKPTRKARKMKDRLDGWKRSDEKRFDGGAPFNPTDPIDLAEFIFR
jgi:hypothetical protein